MSDSLVRVSRRPNGSPQADARSTQVPKHTETARASNHNRDDDVSTSMSTARAWATITIRVGPCPESIGDRLSPFHIRPRHIAGPHPLPSRQFQALFDSLFKVLFIFPSPGYLFAIGLSPVLALDGNLPPDWGCIPKQPDSPTAPRGATGSGHDGALTLSGAPFQGTWARSATEDASPDYNSDTEGGPFSWWLFPPRLPEVPVLGGQQTPMGQRVAKLVGHVAKARGQRCGNTQAGVPRPNGLRRATCVQRLDGSRDSAIHTKYRISLRSSSMQEPRYPLPRVFRISVSQRRPHEHRLRADGGELNDFNFLGAFSGLLTTSPAANRPRRRNPNTSPDHSIGRATGVVRLHKSKNFTSDYEIRMPPTVPVNHYSDPEGQHNRIRILWCYPMLMYPERRLALSTLISSKIGNLRALLPSLDVVAVSQAPSPESNPNSPSPVTTMVGHYPTIES
ncbi:hypothetical protein Lal_00046543 [Lupinus albus]|nr:hypothetical protein Lal_00046543 [Lupinus albus]